MSASDPAPAAEAIRKAKQALKGGRRADVHKRVTGAVPLAPAGNKVNLHP
jgi:hypothetical protein